MAADFVADLTDELGVGCGCFEGVRWVVWVGETGFLWGFRVGGECLGEKPGFLFSNRRFVFLRLCFDYLYRALFSVYLF